MSEEVEIVCPNCGNTKIKEWSKVEIAQDVYQVTRLASGDLEVTDWGETEVIYETSEHIGYACSLFCEGKTFPLEHYVAKEA